MKRLLAVATVIVVVAISKRDKLTELLEIWPTLTAMEKGLVVLVCVLIAAVLIAMYRGVAWLERRLQRRR